MFHSLIEWIIKLSKHTSWSCFKMVRGSKSLCCKNYKILFTSNNICCWHTFCYKCDREVKNTYLTCQNRTENILCMITFRNYDQRSRLTQSSIPGLSMDKLNDNLTQLLTNSNNTRTFFGYVESDVDKSSIVESTMTLAQTLHLRRSLCICTHLFIPPSPNILIYVTELWTSFENKLLSHWWGRN